MRGRVGRGKRKAFCYMLTPPRELLPTDARRRLEAIESFSELGSGMHIAMQDLDIRVECQTDDRSMNDVSKHRH